MKICLNQMALLYENINKSLVVYEVQSESLGRYFYIKEFVLPTEKIKSFIDYLKTELVGVRFKKERSDDSRLLTYSSISKSSNDYIIHRFNIINLAAAPEVKDEFFIGIDHVKDMYKVSPDYKKYPLKFILKSSFPNQVEWP